MSLWYCGVHPHHAFSAAVSAHPGTLAGWVRPYEEPCAGRRLAGVRIGAAAPPLPPSRCCSARGPCRGARRRSEDATSSRRTHAEAVRLVALISELTGGQVNGTVSQTIDEQGNRVPDEYVVEFVSIREGREITTSFLALDVRTRVLARDELESKPQNIQRPAGR